VDCRRWWRGRWGQDGVGWCVRVCVECMCVGVVCVGWGGGGGANGGGAWSALGMVMAGRGDTAAAVPASPSTVPTPRNIAGPAPGFVEWQGGGERGAPQNKR
jgi:hypothetical protein